MSDRVAHNRQSTCNKHTHDQNMHEPFLNCVQACLAPKPPILESRHMRERSHKHASLTITHNDQNHLSNYTFQTQQQYYMDKNSPGKQFESDVTN